MVNVFTGAERGFLGSNLKKQVKGINIDYGDILSINKNIPLLIDNIYHFAGPSDSFDFKDQDKTIQTIVNGTINMLRVAKQTNAKFIFASTKGVETPDNVYCYSKLLMERYIQDNYDNWIILRIPRVYDKSRKKGLMRKLRLNLVSDNDMVKKIEFITLEEFIKQTLKVVNKHNIVYNYDNFCCKTIENIKQLYV